MAEKLTEVLEQYGITDAVISRGRGAYLCHSPEGIYKLEPFSGSEGRLFREYELKEQLFHAGFQNIDRYIQREKEEEAAQDVVDQLIAADRYRNAYVLKQYFDGHECDLKNEKEVGLAVENLCDLHQAGRRLPNLSEMEIRPKAADNLRRHNRELKRVRNFVAKQNHKNTFEMMYLSQFQFFYDRALRSEMRLCETKAYDHKERFGLCHGAYHQHNVLILRDGVATVHFEQFHYDNQLADLYYFTRKLLEKNHFQYTCFVNVLKIYNSKIELTPQDYEYLYWMFSYPEKFWKLSNHYMNGNKAWIPPKTIEKLEGMRTLEQEKEVFLSEFQKDYAIPIS